MAINPAQAGAATKALTEVGLPKKSSPGNSGFDTLLKSLQGAGAGNSALSKQQAAAELLRLEMMYASLSIAGDAAEPPVAGTRTMETLLAALAANRGTPNTGPACWAAAPEPALSGEASATVSQEQKPEIDLIGDTASNYIGTPYRFGGEGPSGIDCSSFVQQVFHEHQIDLPRTAREQVQVGSEVAEGDLRKGDLVFFQTYASYPSHVGIYLGDGKMIHASSGKGEVTISDMNSDYYRPRYLGAKRVI